MHAEKVLTDQQKREQQLLSTIEKNVMEAQQKALEKEMMLKQKREEVNTSALTAD